MCAMGCNCRVFFMKNSVLVYVILIVTLFFSVTCSATQLRFVAEDLYPLHFKDKNNQPDGFLVDVVNAVLDDCACAGKIEIMPQARAFRELQSQPNVVMMSLLKTPGREKNYLFLGSVFNAHAYLVGLKSNQFELFNLHSARGLRVSTVRGYFSQRYLENAGFSLERDLVLAPEPESLMKMLYKNRTDLVLTNTLHLDKELTSIGLDPTKIEKKLHLPDFPNELHITANKKLENTLAIKLTNSLNAIKHNGQYQMLLAKWNLNEKAH